MWATVVTVPGQSYKWIVVVTLAVTLLLATIFLLPRAWLDFLSPRTRFQTSAPTGRGSSWLVLQPPPEIEIASIEPLNDQAVLLHRRAFDEEKWWREGWSLAEANRRDLLFERRAAEPDTLLALLAELGLGVDFMTKARPDSILAARLLLWQVEQGFGLDGEVKITLDQVRRSKVYSQIQSRAADLFKEHLNQDIEVTDYK